MTRWIFWSTEHLVATLAGIVFAALFALAVVVSLGGPAAGPTPAVPSSPSWRPSQAPMPPTDAPPVTPLPSSLSPTPIALEAADAFLAGDLERFARVALPAAVESASDAQAAAGGQLAGQAQVLDASGGKQTVQVPTTDGNLQMVMVQSAGRWRVESMRYLVNP
jgi:hypothetical protein